MFASIPHTVGARIRRHLLPAGEDDSKVSLDDIETSLLKQAVMRAQDNAAAAARLLGSTRPAMVSRLKSRGIVHYGE